MSTSSNVASLCVIEEPFRDGFAVAAGPGAAGDDGNPGHQNPFVEGPTRACICVYKQSYRLYLLRQASTPRHVAQPAGTAEIKPEPSDVPDSPPLSAPAGTRPQINLTPARLCLFTCVTAPPGDAEDDDQRHQLHERSEHRRLSHQQCR
jgi:hypothetical protein